MKHYATRIMKFNMCVLHFLCYSTLNFIIIMQCKFLCIIFLFYINNNAFIYNNCKLKFLLLKNFATGSQNNCNMMIYAYL
ncbi:hypothetical protein C2G38_2146371 [Gigaspora rosea]|uniref:Uncharacterized protein n=1 Tax=Gigaspora rosea TaxID=44941 RepID=A0A397UHN0_9GLOM|nr:hypothetical protein C2G38_2146371 [Gigaspora rosea]